MADNRSILVVVDTNRPDQVECRPLLEAISKVCVVDHHRRAADYINPVVVNLHEPYASSAAELVTEVLMYAVEKKDVLPIEGGKPDGGHLSGHQVLQRPYRRAYLEGPQPSCAVWARTPRRSRCCCRTISRTPWPNIRSFAPPGSTGRRSPLRR